MRLIKWLHETKTGDLAVVDFLSRLLVGCGSWASEDSDFQRSSRGNRER